MNQRDLDMGDVYADAARMEDAQEAADQAKIAAGHAAVETEIAAEDALAEADGPELAMVSLRGRLERFLRTQPDIAEVEEVADGIFGFVLAGAGGVSLGMNITP